ncbi:hypothetical protein Tco_0738007 [Tanacetum coccineum]
MDRQQGATGGGKARRLADKKIKGEFQRNREVACTPCMHGHGNNLHLAVAIQKQGKGVTKMIGGVPSVDCACGLGALVVFDVLGLVVSSELGGGGRVGVVGVGFCRRSGGARILMFGVVVWLGVMCIVNAGWG